MAQLHVPPPFFTAAIPPTHTHACAHPTLSQGVQAVTWLGQDVGGNVPAHDVCIPGHLPKT